MTWYLISSSIYLQGAEAMRAPQGKAKGPTLETSQGLPVMSCIQATTTMI